MTDFSGKLLDGYALSTTDGYNFTTPWLDVHGAQNFSLTAMITGGTVTGVLTLQQSNAKEAGNSNGVYPLGATSTTTSPPDACNVPTDAAMGLTSITLAASATPVALAQHHIGYHWARLSGVLSVKNQTGKVDIWFHWKK
ncbi:MAG: hypothetical protein ABSB40_12045 [Nitrososphaeria archaeon]|jgi:hypothetical protein